MGESAASRLNKILFFLLNIRLNNVFNSMRKSPISLFFFSPSFGYNGKLKLALFFSNFCWSIAKEGHVATALWSFWTRIDLFPLFVFFFFGTFKTSLILSLSNPTALHFSFLHLWNWNKIIPRIVQVDILSLQVTELIKLLDISFSSQNCSSKQQDVCLIYIYILSL